MRSPADARQFAEWALRGALLVALGAALWRSVQRVDDDVVARAVSPATIGAELDRALSGNRPFAWNLTMSATTSRSTMDALVAVRRAGVPVRWHGGPPALAVAVVQSREPASRARVLLVGNGDSAVALADSAGELSVVRGGSGSAVDVSTTVGRVRATLGAFEASAASPAVAPPRAVLVLGRPGWESKFVASALVETGWQVRARTPAAPGVVVVDDGIFPIDTSRYDVVIALDSTAAELSAAITRFVAQGGGLVIGGGAAHLTPFRAMGPGPVSARVPGRILLAEDTVTPRDLPMRHLTSLRADAVALQREGAGVTLAARRAGLGRVITVGYDESWRWRMLGGTSGLAAHRDWWSRAVSSVAPVRDADGAPSGREAAPRAALIDALGSPSDEVLRAGDRTPGGSLPNILLIVIALALLAETASRRFRGVR